MMFPRALVVQLMLVMLVVVNGPRMTAQAVEKDLPEVTAKAYIAKFTGAIQEKSYYMYAEEKYDSTQNKASLTVVQGDSGSSIIMNYADQLIVDRTFSVSTGKDTNCYIIPMSKAETMPGLGLKDDFHFFGGFMRSSAKGIPHLFSTKDIFSLNNTKPFTYQGTTLVAGVQADYWSSTMDWPDDKDTFTVSYYFTVPGWSSPEDTDNTKVYPLRIEINGKKTLANGQTSNLHHYYDYIDFNTLNYLTPEDFDIPDQDSCSVLQPEKRQHPSIPDVMSYTREVIDSKGNVEVVDVDYNHNRGMMQFRSVDRFVMYDFNDGVKYTIGYDGSCAQSAIDPNVDDDAATKGGYVADVGPLEFWLLNNTFTYAGEKRTRYIDSSSWIGRIDNLPFDVHFAKTGWSFQNHILNATSALPPLSMTRLGKQYNFFNFRMSDDTNFHRNLMVCRSWRDIKYAVVVFHQGSYPYANNADQALAGKNIYTLSTAVAKSASVNPNLISVNPVKSYVQDRHLYLYLAMFAPPAPRYLYRQQNKTEIQQGSYSTVTTSTVSASSYNDAIDQSTKMCEKKTLAGSFNCRNFDLCKKSGGTYNIIMYDTLPANAKTKKSTSCDHFARSVDTKPDTSLAMAWSNLQDSVTKGHLKLQVDSHTRYGKKYNLVAIETKMQTRLGDLEHDVEDPGYKFNYYRQAGSLVKTEVINSVENFPVCASQCLARTEYDCKAFEYCLGTQQCILSASDPKPITSGPRSSCFILTRNYIADFTAMNGFTLQNTGNKVFNNVSNSNECARKCMQNSGSPCESFNYCENSKQCTLSNAHAYGVPSSQIVNASRSCTHYSKNYIFDFHVTKKTKVVSSADYGVEAVSVSNAEKCAYLCRTGYDGQGCLQFDFCQDSSVCQIVSNTAKSRVGYKASSQCDVYTLNDAQQSKLKASASTAGSSTYSDGSFGGLAIGMILLGLALGALVVFVLHRTHTLHKIIT